MSSRYTLFLDRLATQPAYISAASPDLFGQLAFQHNIRNGEVAAWLQYPVDFLITASLFGTRFNTQLLTITSVVLAVTGIFQYPPA